LESQIHFQGGAKVWFCPKAYDAALNAIGGHQRFANLEQTNMMAGKLRYPAKN